MRMKNERCSSSKCATKLSLLVYSPARILVRSIEVLFHSGVFLYVSSLNVKKSEMSRKGKPWNVLGYSRCRRG